MAKRISKQDVTGDFPSALDELKAKFGSLDTAIHASDELIKMFKADIGKLRKEIGSIDLSNVKGVKEFNAKQVEAQKVMLTTARLEQQNIKLLQEKEKLKQQELRTQKAVNQQSAKTLTAYQQESRALTEMRDRYKDLAVQKMNGVKLTREEEKEYRRLIPQIRQTDQALKKIDATGGQFQRSVGNYPKAINGFRNALGQLGVAFGVFQLAGAGGKALIEFENSLASFRTIVSDLNDVQFEKYKNQITSVADTTKRSNTEIAQSFEVIAGLNSEFAKTADGLGDVSEAVSTLSKASGDELATSAESLVGIMNQFDLGANQANRAINVLAAGQAVGASSITQSAEAYKNFGAVAKGANITLEQSQALIQVLGKNSIFGAEAGTKLRGVTLQLQKAQLGYASGTFNINDALDEFRKKLDSKATAQAKDAYATKVFGAENITAGKIVSSNIPLFEKYTKAVTGTSEAQKASEINSNTLSNRWIEFKNVLENTITSSTSTNGSLGTLKDTLKFLADNIDGVIKVLTTGAKAFVTYKIAMQALKLKDAIGDWKKMGTGISGVTDSLKGGSEGAKSFGNALKGVGLTAFIALLAEVVQEFKYVASGALVAEKRIKSINDLVSEGGKLGAEASDRYKKSLDKQLQSIQRLDVSESEKARLSKQAVKNTQTAVLMQVESLKKTRDQISADRKMAVARRDAILESRKGFGIIQVGMKDQQILYGKSENAVTMLTAKEKGYNETIKALLSGIESYTDKTADLNYEEQQLSVSTGKATKAVKEKAKAYKDANDQIERMVALMQETQDLTDEIALFEAEEDLQSAIESQLESIEQSGQYSLDLINQKIQAEYDLRKAIIERQFIEQMDSATNEQEVINARVRRDFEIGKLDTEFVLKRKETNKELEDAQEAHAEKIKSTVEKTVEKNYENERKYIDLTTKFLEDQIDKRIALLEKESEAHKKQQDYFRGLAESGNINAQQSLAEEARLQRQADAEKAKLERRKQYIQVVSAFLTEYTNRLEKGESNTQAFTGALASKAAMEAFIGSLPAFYEGTESTGKTSNPLDSNGGRLSILHDDERVMTKKQNDQLGKMSNAEVVAMVQKGKIADAVETGNKGWQNISMLTELNGLRNDVKGLTKAVKDKPETDYQVEQIIQGMLSITKTKKEGINRTINKTIIRGK